MSRFLDRAGAFWLGSVAAAALDLSGPNWLLATVGTIGGVSMLMSAWMDAASQQERK